MRENKHCRNLVSCSDKERNCIQAHETLCKPMELHVISWNFMQDKGPASKLIDLHESSCNCMQAGPSYKLIDLHAFWNILEYSACILEHSACILEHSACILEHSVVHFQLCPRTDGQTDRRTLGLVELRLRS